MFGMFDGVASAALNTCDDLISLEAPRRRDWTYDTGPSLEVRREALNSVDHSWLSTSLS